MQFTTAQRPRESCSELDYSVLPLRLSNLADGLTAVDTLAEEERYMYQRIRAAIEAATVEKQKLATFQYEVLRHASLLDPEDAEVFCREVNVSTGYIAEFRQMLALDKVMRARGFQLI